MAEARPPREARGRARFPPTGACSGPSGERRHPCFVRLDRAWRARVYSGRPVSRFLDRLRAGPPLVADGGMGALVSGAVHGLRCPEEANLRAPESVVAVHAGFIAAGAELIETNTFGANRRKLARVMLEDAFEELNSAGVRLAREAREVSGRDVFVAGSIGPLGELEVFEPAEHGPLYAEQARVLEGRGVDLFMVETFFDLDELVVAVDAVRSVSSLPIVALLTFDDEAEVTGGVGASAAAARLAALDVAAIGTNHGAGPTRRAPCAAGDGRRGAAARGAPERRAREPHGAADRLSALDARLLRRVRRAGRRPRRADRRRLLRHHSRPDRGDPRGLRRGAHPRRDARWSTSRCCPSPPPPTRRRRGSRARCARASGSSASSSTRRRAAPCTGSSRRRASSTRRARVGFVDVNDNPMARARMNALMTSATLQREVGIETIPHVTPRDTTVMGLEGMLLGAHAEGVRNVLAVTGDPPHVGDYPGARGVYEVDAIGLVQLVSSLNRGEDYVGKGLDAPTSFFVGVAVNPSADELELELERFRLKVEAGAHFAMTQAIFDIALLDRFAERLGGWPVPLLVGIWPLRSHAMALRLHNEVPGISVPPTVLDALEAAGADAPSVGLDLARELVAGSRTRASGIYVIPPFKQPLGALDLLG